MSWLVDYAAMISDGACTALTARGPQRWRRLGFLVVLLTAFPLWVGFTRLCLALDRLLFPAAFRAPLDAPLFILGNHRTGSTFLHRLLARDTETFATARLWDLLLPSLVQKRAAAVVAAVTGAAGRRALGWLDARWGRDYRQVHPMGILLAEEDEYFLFYWLKSAALWECFPKVARLRRLFWSDTEMAPAELDRAMAAYREVALRHRRWRGGSIWMSKNPLFTTRISGLLRAFPDARFVLLIRDPREVVPSTASLLHKALRGVGALGDEEQDMALVHEICERFYEEPPALLAGLPPERLAVVRYEDLRADLPGAVEGFLSQLQIPLTPALRQALEEAARAEHRRTHRYQLADWALTEEALDERYAEVIRRYDYR